MLQMLCCYKVWSETQSLLQIEKVQIKAINGEVMHTDFGRYYFFNCSLTSSQETSSSRLSSKKVPGRWISPMTYLSKYKAKRTAATHNFIQPHDILWQIMLPVAINSIQDFCTQNDLKQIYWSTAHFHGGPLECGGHTTNLLFIITGSTEDCSTPSHVWQLWVPLWK